MGVELAAGKLACEFILPRPARWILAVAQAASACAFANALLVADITRGHACALAEIGFYLMMDAIAAVPERPIWIAATLASMSEFMQIG